VITLHAKVAEEWRRLAAQPGSEIAGWESLPSAVREVLPPAAEATAALMLRTGASREWGGLLATDDAGRPVGMCGYKGPPDAAGIVEIAYFTFPPYERRGIASAMAAELLERARRARGVRCIRAHTLPQESASTAILRRLEFSCAGPVLDPEDGEVWRWDYPVDPSFGR
jgi:[ribosomal protein S5]-alanine N-acetyltransferase